MRPLRGAVFVLLVGGCAYGVDGLVAGPPAPADIDGGSTPAWTATSPPIVDASVVLDATPASEDAGETVDASDAAPDAKTDAASRDASPLLDPKLDPPSPHGDACSAIGSSWGCPFGQTCRIATPDGGRCDSFDLGLYGAPCARSADCDTTLQCYAGACTYVCRLGSSDCGKPSACLAVGNAKFGVCKL